MRKTVVALYDRMDEAQQAVRDLVDSGIPRDQISLVARDKRDEQMTETGEGSGAVQGAGVGAGVGAALGAVGGLLVGSGALALPGIGPVLAAGPLAVALGGVAGAGAGAIAGGAAGGLIGGLTEIGVSEQQAGNFAEGIRRGGSLITVMTDETFSPHAKDILNRHHPVDLKDRVSQWQQSGWNGFNPSNEPYSIRKDQEMGSTIPLGGPTAASPGYTSISGELRNTDMNQSNLMREREMGSQEEIGAQTGLGTRNFNTYTSEFQNHYANFYAQRGYTFDDYLPAYQYGYDLANNERYKRSDWTFI
ncbi:MAG: hypothetical protein PHQ40_21660, partial [Anaerolineaceae bacterium]|nr:hypothetical protein [Anaerolineaceae bacterium]